MDHGCKCFDLADLSRNGYLKKCDKIVVLPFLIRKGDFSFKGGNILCIPDFLIFTCSRVCDSMICVVDWRPKKTTCFLFPSTFLPALGLPHSPLPQARWARLRKVAPSFRRRSSLMDPMAAGRFFKTGMGPIDFLFGIGWVATTNKKNMFVAWGFWGDHGPLGTSRDSRVKGINFRTAGHHMWAMFRTPLWLMVIYSGWY